MRPLSSPTTRSPAWVTMVVRCTLIGAYVNQIAGSNYRMQAHKFLPMSYMICEVCFGKCPNQQEIEDQQGSRNLWNYDHTNMSEDLTRAGSDQSLCLPHELLRSCAPTGIDA